MSSPSSLCVGIHRPWDAEGDTRNGSNLDASMQILFSTLRHLEKSTRNPRGFLIPYHVASDGLGICFAFLVCFMRPFHIYLLLFPSVSRVCVCCFPRPSPNSRSYSRSYSCSCCCAWNRAEKLAQNVDVEMKFNLTFLLTQFCVSSESGFWPCIRVINEFIA